MISVRTIALAVLLISFHICILNAMVLQPYEQELTPIDKYRLYGLGDYLMANKRVPSAGDMMVRFGKRSV